MRVHCIKRPAVAMIELVFAIAVMGLILMTAPQIVRTAASSGYVAMQQEAINEAATRMNIILSYPWDENNTNELYIPPILRVTNGSIYLNESGTTGRRAGTPPQSSRTFYRTDGQDFNASSIGPDGGDLDDMDDFNNVSGLIEIESSTADYIESSTIQITSAVTYGDDNVTDGTYANPGGDNDIDFSPSLGTSAPPTTNIKYISVTLTSTGTTAELNKTIILRGFSCNIGGYIPEERIF